MSESREHDGPDASSPGTPDWATQAVPGPAPDVSTPSPAAGRSWEAVATHGAAPAAAWRRPWSGWGSPGRWSGRRTVVALVAALGIGALGAAGATAAITQSDGGGRGDLGGRGGQGQFPGGPGQGRLPGGGQGQVPGAPRDRDGDGDHHGFGDHDGDHDGDGSGSGLPGRQGQLPGGSQQSTPGDANGTAPTT
ncbi:hypothetical protein [Phycicoccus sonneratiae]|uniref:Uncharacterized protein n=1 Tax=Phycicoccus sonneratiae TaxID=2807628 RepID=A0ABS2CR15_9MICO|nr:hypothetical protein [Phycicoccus sonneraticus]MBM6401576.1 hypothetical protein [Phycicoccus sonneraticus]